MTIEAGTRNIPKPILKPKETAEAMGNPTDVDKLEKDLAGSTDDTTKPTPTDADKKVEVGTIIGADGSKTTYYEGDSSPYKSAEFTSVDVKSAPTIPNPIAGVEGVSKPNAENLGNGQASLATEIVAANGERKSGEQKQDISNQASDNITKEPGVWKKMLSSWDNVKGITKTLAASGLVTYAITSMGALSGAGGGALLGLTTGSAIAATASGVGLSAMALAGAYVLARSAMNNFDKYKAIKNNPSQEVQQPPQMQQAVAQPANPEQNPQMLAMQQENELLRKALQEMLGEIKALKEEITSLKNPTSENSIDSDADVTDDEFNKALEEFETGETEDKVAPEPTDAEYNEALDEFQNGKKVDEISEPTDEEYYEALEDFESKTKEEIMQDLVDQEAGKIGEKLTAEEKAMAMSLVAQTEKDGEYSQDQVDKIDTSKLVAEHGELISYKDGKFENENSRSTIIRKVFENAMKVYFEGIADGTIKPKENKVEDDKKEEGKEGEVTFNNTIGFDDTAKEATEKRANFGKSEEFEEVLKGQESTIADLPKLESLKSNSKGDKLETVLALGEMADKGTIDKESSVMKLADRMKADGKDKAVGLKSKDSKIQNQIDKGLAIYLAIAEREKAVKGAKDIRDGFTDGDKSDEYQTVESILQYVSANEDSLREFVIANMEPELTDWKVAENYKNITGKNFSLISTVIEIGENRGSNPWQTRQELGKIMARKLEIDLPK